MRISYLPFNLHINGNGPVLQVVEIEKDLGPREIFDSFGNLPSDMIEKVKSISHFEILKRILGQAVKCKDIKQYDLFGVDSILSHFYGVIRRCQAKAATRRSAAGCVSLVLISRVP